MSKKKVITSSVTESEKIGGTIIEVTNVKILMDISKRN
ncbi:hypothetical protein TcasGA2_TC031039 [Tribolium castaneum]|uniref:Uncharacterized protein n=1 Tax=Tribolium castaneum TaxID=7070 RepID=A0A139WLN8_TRICA|nr:hypothetical protein TcasGA2_TC031039 [Tribolium castaneum]